MSLAFKQLSEEIEGRPVSCAVAALGNAVLVLIYEGEEPVWGSTTVSLPGAASSQILGDRDLLVGRTIGGNLAKRTGKMTLVSTHLGQGYPDGYGLKLLELAKRTVEKDA